MLVVGRNGRSGGMLAEKVDPNLSQDVARNIQLQKRPPPKLSSVKASNQSLFFSKEIFPYVSYILTCNCIEPHLFRSNH
jgi:hypothetical protein